MRAWIIENDEGQLHDSTAKKPEILLLIYVNDGKLYV